jgi:hypothetical protein
LKADECASADSLAFAETADRLALPEKGIYQQRLSFSPTKENLSL